MKHGYLVDRFPDQELLLVSVWNIEDFIGQYTGFHLPLQVGVQRGVNSDLFLKFVEDYAGALSVWFLESPSEILISRFHSFRVKRNSYQVRELEKDKKVDLLKQAQLFIASF